MGWVGTALTAAVVVQGTRADLMAGERKKTVVQLRGNKKKKSPPARQTAVNSCKKRVAVAATEVDPLDNSNILTPLSERQMFSSGSAHRSTREGSPPIRREWFATEPDQSSGDDGFAATKRRRPASPFQASLRRSRARDPGRDDSDSGVPGRACPVERQGMRARSLLFPAGDGGWSLDGSVTCAACARIAPTAAATDSKMPNSKSQILVLWQLLRSISRL